MEYYVTTFKIEAVGESFYANGRHQCKVQISVLKQAFENGDYVKKPLTESEISSIKVAKFSADTNYDSLGMPTEWTTTDVRDTKYNLGTMSDTRSASVSRRFLEESGVMFDAFPDAKALSLSADVKDDNNNVPEVFERYVSGSLTGTEKLMAKMILENETDQTLTTNMSVGENVYDSSINLTAIPPFSISSSSLDETIQTEQHQVYDEYKPDITQEINVYFWTLPNNLKIVERTGSQDSFYALGTQNGDNSFLTRGRTFSGGTHDVNARDNMEGGCVQSHAYTVTVADTELSASALQVDGCSWTSDTYSGTATIDIVDNYGSEHKFKVSPSDSGRSLTIASL
ncbi:hypothetical protein CW749_10505 [Vibrio sp. vnigr-6D03]|uniref:hypothetical protein n=1 Tax=Vibrio sp. vnigr-6D03 TaxID=2058088 RepID=UPI000C33A663|nr:hypothetical protein [Vibrio sp. vnigr-6D03]PKF80106.1 hypothetical protein CW749_10505 [Vibrio sp. vnigr-6D03]